MAGYMATAGSGDWNTPQNVVDRLLEMWRFIDLDPCSNGTSIVGARRTIEPPGDGLSEAWSGRVFVNPPFVDMSLWMDKCVKESQRAEIVLLAPSRTDTLAWHRTLPTANAVCMWRGRLRFGGAPAPCPFPTAFLYWGLDVEGFDRAFGEYGLVLPVPHATPRRFIP